MAKTVKLPLVGQANKGTVVGVVIAGTVVTGYLIYRQNKKAKTSAAAASAVPATSGYGYGAGTFPGGYYGYGEQPYGYGSSGGFFPGYYGYGVPQPQPTANATNAQWAQAAISQLGSEGYDPQTVSASLGAYLMGAAVTAAQVPIVQAAIGIEGYPPQPGTNGFPPSINTGGTPGGGAGGGQSGGGNTQKITTAGSHPLSWYATKYAVSESQLVTWNPNLAAYDKPRTNVPNGLSITV